jgi:sec-independent protein translocase protein TatA
MFGLGAPELIVILVVALLVFGPGRLPEIGGALGKGIRDFRKAFEGADKEATEKLEDQAKATASTSEHS